MAVALVAAGNQLISIISSLDSISRFKYKGGNPARQNNIATKCFNSKVYARARSNRNSGKGNGSGCEIMSTKDSLKERQKVADE